MEDDQAPNFQTLSIAERIAELSRVPTMDDRRTAAVNLVNTLVEMHASRLEELARTDDLSLVRDAKDADCSVIRMQRFFRENLPLLAVKGYVSDRNLQEALELVRVGADKRGNFLRGAAKSMRELIRDDMSVEAVLEVAKEMRDLLDALPAAARVFR